MRITWYGHAAFLIETQGLRIILDPYRSPESGGYLPIDEPADLVIVSHENDCYHSYTGQIVPPFQLVNALELPPGGEVIKGIRFETVHAFETPERLPEEEVTIIHFRSEDMHVVYLGDLGHPLTEDEVAPLRGADIVLIPAGSTPTIAYPEIPPCSMPSAPGWSCRCTTRRARSTSTSSPCPGTWKPFRMTRCSGPGSARIEVTRATLPETRTEPGAGLLPLIEAGRHGAGRRGRFCDSNSTAEAVRPAPWISPRERSFEVQARRSRSVRASRGSSVVAIPRTPT